MSIFEWFGILIASFVYLAVAVRVIAKGWYDEKLNHMKRLINLGSKDEDPQPVKLDKKGIH